MFLTPSCKESLQEYDNMEGHTMRGYAENRTEVRPRSQERNARL